jgi:hypothetical protein
MPIPQIDQNGHGEFARDLAEFDKLPLSCPSISPGATEALLSHCTGPHAAAEDFRVLSHVAAQEA